MPTKPKPTTSKFIPDPIEKPVDDSELTLLSFIARRKFNRELISERDTFRTIRRVEVPASVRSKSGALISPIYAQQQKQLLTRNQLLQCADAYTNDGIIRTAINKHVDFILTKRTKFTVELNEELTEFATPEEIDALKSELKSSEVEDLRTNIIRINKRVQLHDRLTKILISAFVFGRSAAQIVRFPKTTGWSQFGEPRAILNLNSTRIVDVQVNPQTGDFEGYYYDYGITEMNKVLIASQKLLPMWIDDVGLYENTMYAGTSPIWPLLNLVYANQIINDEDIPESTKTTWAKFALIYSGTSKQSITARINEQLKAGTALVHNQEKMRSEVYDLGKDIRELTDIRKQNCEFMMQCLGLPIFFMFEDVPNFATAGKTIQAYREGTLSRHRTMLRGILEKYWYDPILADTFNIPMEDVITLKIKVNAAFEDIIFEEFKEKVEALVMLKNAGIYDDEECLEALGADRMLERKRQMDEMEQDMLKDEINAFKEQQAANGQAGGNGNGFPPSKPGQQQQKEKPQEEDEPPVRA